MECCGHPIEGQIRDEVRLPIRDEMIRRPSQTTKKGLGENKKIVDRKLYFELSIAVSTDDVEGKWAPRLT